MGENEAVLPNDIISTYLEPLCVVAINDDLSNDNFHLHSRICRKMELNHPIITITILSLIPIFQRYAILLSSSYLKPFFGRI